MIPFLLGAVAAAVPPPVVAPCAVMRPTFTVDGRNVSAGAMFATKVGDQVVLVTAHHLFGPPGGLPAPLPAAEVPKRVTAVSVRDAVSRVDCGRADRALTVADAAPMDNEQSERDLAVFLPTVASGLDRIAVTKPAVVAPLPLAARAPKVGDPVWLASPVEGGSGTTHAAKVVAVEEGALYFAYDDPKLDLTATSGAPILDATGAVVGLNLGGGTMPDGALVGSANSAASLLRRIEAALRVTP